jgi:DNA polymerase III subunit delta
MKLSFSQLESHLAKKLASIYIMSSDELLLKQDALKLIHQAAKRSGFTERIRLTPETGEQLYAVLYSSSLLAEQRLIELNLQTNTPNKTISTILQEYTHHPVTQNVLVIDMSKADTKTKKSSWYQALEKKGITITIWPITREALPQWIKQRAQTYALSLSTEVVHLLVNSVEGNLVAAAQAIEKIWLLQLEKPIDPSLLKAILVDESHFTIFDFVEALIAGHTSRTLRILAHLQKEGTEPSLILWAITRELRLLAAMSQELTTGMTYDTLWQKHQIFARRQPALYHFLKNYSVQDCWQFIKKASHIDRVIKGVAIHHVWDALQIFCLRFDRITDLHLKK